MADITIRPADGFNTQVQVSNGTMLVSEQDTIDLIEQGTGAGYTFQVERRCHGYTLTSQIEKAAAKAAGLDLNDLQTIKALASTGTIEW